VFIHTKLLFTNEFCLLVNVHLPKDRISMSHQGYGFCEFLTEEDAEYACKIMNQIKLWGKPIRVNKVSILGFVPLWALEYLSDTHE
jgi:RNA recognition motif-containing protein